MWPRCTSKVESKRHVFWWFLKAFHLHMLLTYFSWYICVMLFAIRRVQTEFYRIISAIVALTTRPLRVQSVRCRATQSDTGWLEGRFFYLDDNNNNLQFILLIVIKGLALVAKHPSHDLFSCWCWLVDHWLVT